MLYRQVYMIVLGLTILTVCAVEPDLTPASVRHTVVTVAVPVIVTNNTIGACILASDWIIAGVHGDVINAHRYHL